MALLSIANYTGDGSTNLWAVPFPYIEQDDVKAYVDGVEDASFTWMSSTSIALSSTAANGAKVQIKRVTDIDARQVTFNNGSTPNATDLNNADIQLFYKQQELVDGLTNSIGLDSTLQWDALSKRIKNVATGTASNDAVNLAQLNAATVDIVTDATAARDAALVAQAAAELAETNAETAETNAETAQTAAELARDQAQAAANTLAFDTITGEGTNYVRAKAAEDGHEYRTPAEVRTDLSLGALALLNTVGTSQIDDGSVTAAKASIASQAEAEAGTDTTKLMTPQRVSQAIAALTTGSIFTEAYTSSAITASGAGSGTLAHGLSSAPKLITVILKCITAELGFTVGQEFEHKYATKDAGSSSAGSGINLVYDNTNIYYKFGSTASPLVTLRQDTGVQIALTNANWEVYVKAFT